MADQIEALRQGLVCGHCAAVFIGTYSQARHFRYEGRSPYCSTVCRHAALRKKLCTEVPSRGPCKNCGEAFRSRTAKQYCSMDCYMASDAFRQMQKNNSQKMERQWRALTPEAREKISDKLRTGEYIECLECGESIYRKKSGRNKYCGKPCYRKYMARRFDRWVANPQNMALPQCYDEFMTQEELPCLIDGCDWSGKHLSVHVNQAHGITADEFKRAAGFNLGTGLVTTELHEAMSVRRQNCTVPTGPGFPKHLVRYVSLEAKEHQKKARALMGNGPQRHCQGCGVVFTQSTPFGRAKYCTIECRDESYANERRGKKKFPVRDEAGMFVRWE